MNVPMLDLAEQHAALMPQFRRVFDQTIASGQLVLGPQVAAFEEALASNCGTRYAIGLSSGTDALVVAMMAMGIGPGDEVIVPTFTFFATAGCVARVGATPRFVDIDPQTFNMDPAGLERALTPRTRAVIPVHLYGQMADMDAIMTLARNRDLKVVEDAAQAIGARCNGRAAGSVGDVGCLSFYPSKNLSAPGDAGACLTNDPELARSMQQLRVHGQGDDQRYHHVGGNFRIDTITAGILHVKLEHLQRWTDARRARAERYHQLLGGLPIDLPIARAGNDHVYNQYTVRVHGGRRDALSEYLTREGVGNRVYYDQPLHRQPCFEAPDGETVTLAVAEQACLDVLSLPMWPEMSESHQNEVVDAVRRFFES